jgi:Fe-S cluster biogenesis protein NfuA/nitrite reductase/ring-hydroxylating ferredoxin subunit
MAAMKAAMSDEVVYAVCRHFGLIKPSLQERIEEALESVRPMLASHGGGVELISVTPPSEVEVRFLGACDGCPASMLTFVEGVKKAIEEHCPEIEHVKQAKGLAKLEGEDSGLRFISPFALNRKGGWEKAAKLEDIPEGGILSIEVGGESLILSRQGSVVSCFQNACAHLGLPLDGEPPVNGILECPHHGFQYDLRSGECLTAPEVQLQPHAVRVVGDQVDVRLSR